MTNTQHTPGPWEISADKYANFKNAVFGPDELKVADCGSSRLTGEVEANARLIAAAPELLEALERAADELKRAQNSNGSQWLVDEEAKARAAIAKAKGEV